MYDNKRCIICDTTFDDYETSICPYCGEDDETYFQDNYYDEKDEGWNENDDYC